MIMTAARERFFKALRKVAKPYDDKTFDTASIIDNIYMLENRRMARRETFIKLNPRVLNVIRMIPHNHTYIITDPMTRQAIKVAPLLAHHEDPELKIIDCEELLTEYVRMSDPYTWNNYEYSLFDYFLLVFVVFMLANLGLIILWPEYVDLIKSVF